MLRHGYFLVMLIVWIFSGYDRDPLVMLRYGYFLVMEISLVMMKIRDFGCFWYFDSLGLFSDIRTIL